MSLRNQAWGSDTGIDEAWHCRPLRSNPLQKAYAETGRSALKLQLRPFYDIIGFDAANIDIELVPKLDSEAATGMNISFRSAKRKVCSLE